MSQSFVSKRIENDPDPSLEDLLIVGWQETIALPEFGIDRLVAKIDSGASMSSLHAECIERIQRRRQTWIRFRTQTDLQGDCTSLRCEARWVNDRLIRSSNGQTELRPVIETMIYLGGFQWPIELSLTDRSSLECKVLLGRSALSSRCLIDCSRKNVMTSP